MQRTSFAPVLSATLSRDSCWIIGSPCRAGSRHPHRGVSLAELRGVFRTCAGERSSLPGTRVDCQNGGCLLGLLEDLDDAPALGGAERTGLHDQDPVAD